MTKTIYVIFFALLVYACREEYLPPAIVTNNNFLVVEGIINSGTDSTIIKLTRTRSLSDSNPEIQEPGATVLVEGKSGITFHLVHLGNGMYGSGPLSLNPAETYRLRISTNNGSIYASDYVEVKQTPPIDSISWKQVSDVTIYANTHDPQNKTRYYRWEFEETWQYDAFYDSNLGFDYVNNGIFFRDSSQLLTSCYRYAISTDILLSTSSNLSEDRIDSFPLLRIPRGSERIAKRYSMLLKQHAITAEAYKYWQLLRKNSKELGSIFGTQPTELISNIRCLSNPNEPVIGFVSISTTTEKRLFIGNFEVFNWDDGSNQTEQCTAFVIQPDSASYYLHTRPDLAPAYFVTGGGLALAKKVCVDCTVKGGSTKKPSYW